MKKLCLPILLVFAICHECYPQVQRYASINYILSNLGEFDGSQMANTTFVGSMLWTKKVSRKDYATIRTSLCGGFRLTRSGYRMEASYPDIDADFYNKYNVYWVNSKLIQHSIGVPLGVEFRFMQTPVMNPKLHMSLRLMLSGSFLLSSNLKEVVDDDNKLSTNMAPYAKKFSPGFIVEAKFYFIVLGVTLQKVKYTVPDGKLNLTENIGSPFYEMISRKGVFSDTYIYMGVEIPIKPKVKK